MDERQTSENKLYLEDGYYIYIEAFNWHSAMFVWHVENFITFTLSQPTNMTLDQEREWSVKSTQVLPYEMNHSLLNSPL